MDEGDTKVRRMPYVRSPRATMSDVARAAGVSEKSVSRVVNREPHVSPKLKAKVDAAIAQLGYVPDPAARSLAGSRSFTINMLLDTRGQHYAIKLIDGAYEACNGRGYHLRIESLDGRNYNSALLTRLEESLGNSRLDGFVVTPPFADNMAILDYLEDRQIRYTRVAPFEQRDRSPCVFIDDAAAAAEVADLLVRKGHRRIGLVNGIMGYGVTEARRKGFLDRIAEIAPDAEIIEADGSFIFEGGIEAGKELLDRSDRPTAIFAANDDSAVGVMSACVQLGLKVPFDVSVCGFDDNWAAKSVWPYLTTVHQPVSQLAAEAVRLLLEPARTEEKPRTLLPHRLVERDTVRDLTKKN